MYKTSKQWLELVPKNWNVEIIHYEGWNRNNFHYSFNQEKISQGEFTCRVRNSTIKCDRNKLEMSVRATFIAKSHII